MHFKMMHSMWLTRATTLLELAMWKVKLEEIEDDESLEAKTKKAKIVEDGSTAARRVYRVQTREKDHVWSRYYNQERPALSQVKQSG